MCCVELRGEYIEHRVRFMTRSFLFASKRELLNTTSYWKRECRCKGRTRPDQKLFITLLILNEHQNKWIIDHRCTLQNCFYKSRGRLPDFLAISSDSWNERKRNCYLSNLWELYLSAMPWLGRLKWFFSLGGSERTSFALARL